MLSCLGVSVDPRQGHLSGNLWTGVVWFHPIRTLCSPEAVDDPCTLHMMSLRCDAFDVLCLGLESR